MISGLGVETDRILGLETAADDFVTKPFSAHEPIARVCAQLRHTTEPSMPRPASNARGPRFCFDGRTLDAAAPGDPLSTTGIFGTSRTGSTVGAGRMAVVNAMTERCPTIPMGADAAPVSRILFGMWRIGDCALSGRERRALVEAALELGATSFDHADIYGGYTAESLFGDVLAEAPHLRERMQIVTKCGIRLVSARRSAHGIKHYDTQSAHLVASAEQSLRALHTDRLDRLLLHRSDPLMDADEVAATFAGLRRDGKVREFGIPKFMATQAELLKDRMRALGMSLATNQVECSLLHLVTRTRTLVRAAGPARAIPSLTQGVIERRSDLPA